MSHAQDDFETREEAAGMAGAEYIQRDPSTDRSRYLIALGLSH